MKKAVSVSSRTHSTVAVAIKSSHFGMDIEFRDTWLAKINEAVSSRIPRIPSVTLRRLHY
jgi:hypothetical protein